MGRRAPLCRILKRMKRGGAEHGTERLVGTRWEQEQPALLCGQHSEF